MRDGTATGFTFKRFSDAMAVLRGTRRPGESEVGKIARTLKELKAKGYMTEDRVRLQLRDLRDQLLAARDRNADVADLVTHPGWVKFTAHLRQRANSLRALEHELIMSDPEQALINWIIIETIEDQLGVFEGDVSVHEEAEQSLRQHMADALGLNAS